MPIDALPPLVMPPRDPSESGARAAFGAFKPGRKIAYIAFDGVLDGQTIYEIWYSENDEYNVSFVTHTEGEGYGFVDTVSVLIQRTAENGRIVEAKMATLKEGRLRLWVAAGAFLISLATLAFMALGRGQTAQTGTIIAAIVGVVSSGALFFFGAWVPSGLFRGKIGAAP